MASVSRPVRRFQPVDREGAFPPPLDRQSRSIHPPARRVARPCACDSVLVADRGSMTGRLHDQSPARFDDSSRSITSRISVTMAWNFGSRCISIDGRSGGGTRMVWSTVPGEFENKRMWSPR